MRFNYILIHTITIARIPLSITFSLIMINRNDSNVILLIGLIFIILIESTDLLDGVFARKYGLVSELGATLDPYSDSITRLVIYWTLAYINLVLFFVPLVMALRDVTVAYCRILLIQNKKSVSARKSGKVKAEVQAVGSLLALLGPFYWSITGYWTFYALSWIVITVTAFSAFEYVKDTIQSFK